MQSRYRIAVSILLFFHLVALVWVAWHLPIGPHEATLYFESDGLVARFMHWGRWLLPHADFINIRLPFLLLHLSNLALFYKLSTLLLKDEKSVLTAFVIYLLLPGVVSSAVLATSTGMILLVYQAFLIFWLQKREMAAYLLLPLFLFIDRSSVIFYFALLTFALWRRKVELLVTAGTLFAAALGIYGIDMHGKPVNYFVDTVALYAAIFSPLVFLYFFYAMYRILLKGEKNIIWHIGFTVLLLSLAISLRQRIPIQDFAPYVIVAIPLMVKLFFHSYRVRLPQFRKRYFFLASVVLAVLVLNTLILLFHKPLFLVMKEPRHHFAAPFYLPYWCAEALKEEGITAVHVAKRKRQEQLRYYGIADSNVTRLSGRPSPGSVAVTIRYSNRLLKRCYVSKINNKDNFAPNASK
ncbi:hypothetical protein [Hydrogenimonas sp. SS33]|uniref:hypothetical protein n=1 Tax=Hydrogenimonas leucolamina TaxID=2954236 RepID=UPI00336C0795